MPLAAFVVALVTVGRHVRRRRVAFGRVLRSGTTLVLAGVAVVSLATAIQTFMLQRHTEVVREVYQWILGGCRRRRGPTSGWSLPYVIVSSIVLILHRRQLDVLRVGDDEAATLGMPVSRSRLVVVVAATLGTAAVVSVSGLIGFVGIVVPHVVRLVAGASYRRLLPLSLHVRRRVPDPRRHPRPDADQPGRDPDRRRHGVLGAPFFIFLLRTRRVPGELARVRDVGVRYGRRRSSCTVQRSRRVGGVARVDRPERCRQVVVAAGDRRARRAPRAIVVDGPLSRRVGRRRAALVAYVPQEPMMPDDMTAFEYVLLGRTPYVAYFGIESRHDRGWRRTCSSGSSSKRSPTGGSAR